MVPGGLRRASDTTLLARAQSMSEAAGFQARPQLINAMELLAGEAPYPAPADMASGKAPSQLDCVHLVGSSLSTCRHRRREVCEPAQQGHQQACQAVHCALLPRKDLPTSDPILSLSAR